MSRDSNFRHVICETILFQIFIFSGVSHHLGSPEWILIEPFRVVLSKTSSCFNPALSISLLHESFHLGLCLPLRLFLGTRAYIYNLFPGTTSTISFPVLHLQSLFQYCIYNLFFRYYIYNLFPGTTSTISFPVRHLQSLSWYYIYNHFHGTVSTISFTVLHLQSLSRYYIYNLFLGTTSTISFSVLHLQSLSRYYIYNLFLGTASTISFSVLHLQSLSRYFIYNLFLGTTSTFPLHFS